MVCKIECMSKGKVISDLKADIYLALKDGKLIGTFAMAESFT